MADGHAFVYRTRFPITLGHVVASACPPGGASSHRAFPRQRRSRLQASGGCMKSSMTGPCHCAQGRQAGATLEPAGQCHYSRAAIASDNRSSRKLPSGQGPTGETRCDNWRLSFRSVDTGSVSYESSVDLPMGTEVEKLASRSSSRAAERMRLYRKRRRGGLLYVRVPLYVKEIDMLIERGLLEARNSTDRKAISTAICDLLAELL